MEITTRLQYASFRMGTWLLWTKQCRRWPKIVHIILFYTVSHRLKRTPHPHELFQSYKRIYDLTSLCSAVWILCNNLINDKDDRPILSISNVRTLSVFSHGVFTIFQFLSKLWVCKILQFKNTYFSLKNLIIIKKPTYIVTQTDNVLNLVLYYRSIHACFNWQNMIGSTENKFTL